MHFSHSRGGGGGGVEANMYQSHQMHTQICMTLTRSNLIVRRIRLMVLSRKRWLLLLKKDGNFSYSFYPIMLLDKAG